MTPVQKLSLHKNLKYSNSLDSITPYIEIDLARFNYKQNAPKKPLSNPNSLQFDIAQG